MTIAELRRQIEECIEQLSPERLQSAADFLRYLKDLESDDAAEQLRRIPGIHGQIEEGLADIEAGRTVNWRKVRDDV